MTHRIIVLLAAIVLGAAAPARAWCEASCLAPQHDSPSHCPSHDLAGDTAISTTSLGECPALESARPPAPARLDASALAATGPTPELKASATHVPAAARPQSTSTVFKRCTPLRI